MALAQDDKLAKRYYSLSSEVLNSKKDYYNILEQSQKSNLNITEWLIWFIDRFETALSSSGSLLAKIFAKADFWNIYQQTELNDRQRKVVNALLDAGKGNFEGGLTTRKYVGITKVSRATAIREINDLLGKNVLIKNQEAGRSVNYDLNWVT
jgi:Fic family protein